LLNNANNRQLGCDNIYHKLNITNLRDRHTASEAIYLEAIEA